MKFDKHAELHMVLDELKNGELAISHDASGNVFLLFTAYLCVLRDVQKMSGMNTEEFIGYIAESYRRLPERRQESGEQIVMVTEE